MNVTVLGLLISGSYGPALFSPAMRKSVSSFSASNCRSLRSFQSFLSSPILNSIKVRGCEFRQFRNSAISVGSVQARYSIAGIATQEHVVIDTSNLVGTIDITLCLFLGCHGTNGGGVSILVSAPDNDDWMKCTVTVSMCTFGDCSATHTGGAMHFMGFNQGVTSVSGSNYIKFCCVGNCQVTEESDLPSYERAFAIYLEANGRGHGETHSLFHVEQSSLLNCDNDNTNIQGFNIAGEIVRMQSTHMNITGRQQGNVGGFGTRNVDWYGRKDKKGGGFKFFHLEGLQCSCCFYCRTRSADSGMYVEKSCIVNIKLLSGVSEITTPSIFFGVESGGQKVQMDTDDSRFIDITGGILESGTWTSINFKNCVTNVDTLTTNGVSKTTSKETYLISAAYLDHCDYDFTGTFAPTATPTPGPTPTQSIPPTNSFTDAYHLDKALIGGPRIWRRNLLFANAFLFAD